MRTAIINIDTSALNHNLSTIRSQLKPQTHVLAMVKSNAYGHGVDLCLKGLKDADGLGVATFAEAQSVYEQCQKLQLNKPIVIMQGAFSLTEWQVAVAQNLSCVIHNQEQVQWALDFCAKPNSHTNTLWLKYNTGMNRLGFNQDELPSIAKALSDKGYQLILTSHFACADEPKHPLNAQQINRFNDLLHQLQTTISPTIQGSLCNSAGIFNFSHAHHHWVRAGIALYGGNPLNTGNAKTLGLMPVMTFSAKIMAIHQLTQGQTVGYGALWQAHADSRIGIVSVGYGDGYPRVVKDAWISIVHEGTTYQAPLVGRVAMDMFMVDLTALPFVDVGHQVILWGNSPTADDIAQCANTISYELFCRTTNRPTRTTNP